MSKVAIFIIDAMDSLQVTHYESELPNLRRLREAGTQVRISSVIPPDSPTALSSIYTGMSPARHGIVHFVDPLERAGMIAGGDFDNTALRGNTFWDIAGKSGKRVDIILPFMGYPVWPVNGVMVGRSTVKEDVQIFPNSLTGQYSLSGLNTVKGFPGSRDSIARYLERQKQLVANELDFALGLLKRGDWDLFVFYSSVLDSVHHPLWRYCDDNDPSYPGPNPYQDVIKNFYQLYDHSIGALISAVDSETTVILLSDHGHGMRPVKLLNINELLRQKGLLVPRAKNPTSRALVGGLEKMKRWALNFVSKHNMGNIGSRLLRLIPVARKIYTAPMSIDWGRTTAYVSDLSGIKAYPYGGIRISRNSLTDNEYEELRDLIIREVGQLREPNVGHNLVNWICRREDLYSGEHIAKYPDIVLELQDDWGIGWAINESLYGTSPSHNLVPGSHKVHSPVFYITNLKGRSVVKRDMNLMDVAPTVLDLLGIRGEFNLDGKSILR